MNKAYIDEYLTRQLRQKIDELVALNLDLESTLSLLSNEIYGYKNYMTMEIRRYVRYLIWLRNNEKSQHLAFEKYKKQTQQTKNQWQNSRWKNKVGPGFDEELGLTQLEKERKRIDEITKMNLQKNSETTQKTEDSFFAEDKADAETFPTTVSASTTTEDWSTLNESTPSSEDETTQNLESEQNTTILDDTNSEDETTTTLTVDEENEDITVPENDSVSESFQSEMKKIIEETMTLMEDGKPDKDEVDEILESLTDEEIEETLAELLNPLSKTNTLNDDDNDDDNDTQTLNDSILLESEEFADETDQTEFVDEDLTAEEIEEASETLVPEDTQTEFVDETTDLTTPLPTLKVGAKITYQDEEYEIQKINVEKDLFNHEQVILTLENLQTEEVLKVNAKKIQ